ncbi:uncharacterized protein LOC143426374 [Xylocopa sonorina]|uniref:uncharacterized protein LOC143426374 n=1 Tax=Xylocopa sonorina TaxID=1818115 RepID=UPI00403AE466
MLCCVSRRVLAGVEQGLPYDYCSSKERPDDADKARQIETPLPEADAPPVLLPCAICARTFMPQSLEKHSKICERSANKKRKPFDSAKQRIQGTELAEFLPRQEKKRHSSGDRSSKPKSTWKQTHDDFLQAIRAARNEIVDNTMQKQGGTTVTPNAPTRANEQGLCPTCNRHFGVKAYDRHVAWCKERITRVPASPATNIAKERLEARMKYRAPAVKSRRQVTREKYAPGSAITLSSGNKTSPTLTQAKTKECASAPSCNKSNDSPVKQKSTVTRRSGQTKEPANPVVPMKSRAIDRVNRPPEDEAGPTTFRPAPPVKRPSYLPVPPLKPKRESLEDCNGIPSPKSCKKQPRWMQEKIKRNDAGAQRMKQDGKHQPTHSARSLKANIVSARSQGNPRVNDVSINDEIAGVTVKPCNIYKENQLTTWKLISQGKDCGSNKENARTQDISVDTKFLDLKERIEDLSVYEKRLENIELAFGGIANEGASKLSSRSGSVNWSNASSTLNRTYSFRDSVMSNIAENVHTGRDKKWKPVRHSPRVEFCLGDPDKMPYRNFSSVNSGFSREMNTENGSKYSRRNLKESSVKSECFKDSLIRDESTGTEIQCDEEDIGFEARSIKLSSEGLKSSRDRILDKKRLKSAMYVDESNSCDNFEAMHLQVPQNNNMTTQILNTSTAVIKNTNSLDCEIAQIASTNEYINIVNEDIQGNLKDLSPISSEQFAYLDEFDRFCETIALEEKNDEPNACEEVNQLTSHSKQSSCEGKNKVTYVKDLRKEDDEFNNIDVETAVLPLQNGLEYPKTDTMDNDSAFYNTETNWIEMESDPSFTECMLQPTRSSTPFINSEECSNFNYDDYENSNKELSGNSEWKIEVDVEAGSEVLYRVESRDSNCLSSRHASDTKIAKPRATDTGNDIVQFRNCSGGRQNEFNKISLSFSTVSSPGMRKEKKNFSKPASPAQQEAEVKFPKTDKKEIASQINICNCSLEISPYFKCEKGVGEGCVNTIENSCYTEAQTRSSFANENFQKGETIQDPLEIRSGINLNETDFNYNPNGSSTRQFDTNERNPETQADVAQEEVQEIYKNNAAKDFDCDSDNSIEHHVQDTTDNIEPSSTKKDRIKQNLRSIVLSESCVRLSQRVRVDDTLMSRSMKSRRRETLEIENGIRRKTILNESSDSLASSMDAFDLADVEQVESVELETIEEIGTRNRSIKFRILPEIKGTTVVVKEDYDGKERVNAQTYWEKASKATRNRLINLDPPYQGASRFLKRHPKVRVLPPVPSSSSLINCRNLELPLRPHWSNYVRRRPDFNLVLSGRTGKDYDPFLLAEQQMNDLLSDTSEQSVTDSPPNVQNRDSSFPLSHSSAFVKYPRDSSLSTPEKRASLIVPPSEFDELTSDFSSDSTETNSLSRELFLRDLKQSNDYRESTSKSTLARKSPVRELGRRVIIDKSRALGGEPYDDARRGSRSFVGSTERARRILDKVSPKPGRPSVNRSGSIRASSAPKTTPDRKNGSNEKRSSRNENDTRSSGDRFDNRNNNYANLSGSNLSLSSIVSSDVDIKRSNSVFDELMTSFEDENEPFPSLKSLLKNDSLSVSSPIRGRQRNGRISDDELSSPESYKKQDHGKMSADSAYSSLNRKYSHHGRSTNDVAARFDEEPSRNNRRNVDGNTAGGKCKMSKYCHECGSKFPETAKFCCECGIRRLAL